MAALRRTLLLLLLWLGGAAFLGGCADKYHGAGQRSTLGADALLPRIRDGLLSICETASATTTQLSCDQGAVFFDEIAGVQLEEVWGGKLLTGNAWTLSVVLNGRRSRSGSMALAQRIPDDTDRLRQLADDVMAYVHANSSSAPRATATAPHRDIKSAPKGCQHDMECKGTRVCEEGQCLSPP